MAPSRRPTNPRAQKGQSTGSLQAAAVPGVDGTSEPPLKKRKYVPGGPGGGGRYVEVDVTEITPVKPNKNKSRPRSQATLQARPTAQAASRSAVRPAVRPVRASKATKPASTSASNLPSSTSIPATPSGVSRPPKRQKANNRAYPSSSAAAIAAAQGDGYKPREERGWEEFHPELDIDANLTVFSSNDVDGVVPDNASADGAENKSATGEAEDAEDAKRRPGRPRGPSILNGISAPEVTKFVPPLVPNPQEKLTLPKPSFMLKDPFSPFEQKGVGQQNYVDRTMASVGYQESDFFTRHDRRLIRMPEPAEDLDLEPPVGVISEGSTGVNVGRVEYDMDEQDARWLDAYNAQRKIEQYEPIKPAIFEITMTKIEKEWHALEKRIPKPNPKPPQTQRPRSSSAAAVNGELTEGGEEQDSKCAVCDDGDCENANAIVFCDGCDLAVHQECYGVPYIPEGQWLCRKCQLLGRARPSCIFCPNTEGAFKQTNTSKWAHVVCAVWIPEVSIGNPALMEPISDVENVPKSRWKLNCYICRQKMGACIQCSNKNCFLAFHVTCGRRAQLYLKMKLIPGAPAIIDSNGLKAYCDKHVPMEWQEEYSTDTATVEAMEYYKDTFQGKVWSDSQAAALALGPEPEEIPDFTMEVSQAIAPRLTLTMGGNRRKKAVKSLWKLPSGAPVIPQVLLDRIAASLQRFTVRQRKQYAEDACKYWTLKREARRGAALLKRLQLQLETFSSMEMTRRNFAGMGVSGNMRLQRRIEFAETLNVDVDKVRTLCDEVKKRERDKLRNVETLRHIVDVVYFPIPPILWPIFEKAVTLDGRGVFRVGLQLIRTKLEERAYTSVSEFSRDIAYVFSSEIGVDSASDTAELQLQISGRAPELSSEQRDKRNLAKRIIRSIQPALEDAVKKESELNGQPFEEELKDLDVILENSVLSRRGSLVEGVPTNGVRPHCLAEAVNDIAQKDAEQKQVLEKAADVVESATPLAGEVSVTVEEGDVKPSLPVQDDLRIDTQRASAPKNEAIQQLSTPTPSIDMRANRADDDKGQDDGSRKEGPVQAVQAQPMELPTRLANSQQQQPLAQGGIQWYMQPFDPVGTTIHEERWMGREVLRGMSEELSEMDDDEMRDLFGEDLVGGGAPGPNGKSTEAVPPAAPAVGRRPRTRGWRG